MKTAQQWQDENRELFVSEVCPSVIRQIQADALRHAARTAIECVAAPNPGLRAAGISIHTRNAAMRKLAGIFSAQAEALTKP